MNTLKTALVVAVGLATALPAEAASSVSVRAGNGGAVISVTSGHDYRDRGDRGTAGIAGASTSATSSVASTGRAISGRGTSAWSTTATMRARPTRRGVVFELVIDAYDGSVLRVSAVRRGAAATSSRGVPPEPILRKRRIGS